MFIVLFFGGETNLEVHSASITLPVPIKTNDAHLRIPDVKEKSAHEKMISTTVLRKRNNVTFYPQIQIPEISAATSSMTQREREFQERLQERCRPWKSILHDWRQKVSGSTPREILIAYQEGYGFGDRLAGIEGALMNAIVAGKRLQIDWLYSDLLFSMRSEFEQEQRPFGYEGLDLVTSKAILNNERRDFTARLVGSKYWKGVRKNSCVNSAYYKCSDIVHQKNNCDVYNRACLSTSFCSKFSILGKLTDVDKIAGCPLRLLLDFTDTVFHDDTTVHVFNDGGLHNTSFLNLIKNISEHHLVAVHLRLGDGVLKMESVNRNISASFLDKSQMLADGITENEKDFLELSLQTATQIGLEKGKPVKIVFASDSSRLRTYVRDNPRYSQNLVILQNEPMHLTDIAALEDESRKQMVWETMLEWFLLYVSDDLITNVGHNFGISSFSRSARLFSLRSDFYKLEFGTKRVVYTTFDYEGNLKIIPRQCSSFKP